MKIFKLPDLGEGLPDAEIVQWHVKPGEDIEVDAPLVSMETAKAVVEIPSPSGGRVERLYGEPGDIVQVGDPLVEFAVAGEQATHGASDERVDAGTVVGRVEQGNQVVREAPSVLGKAPVGIKATPAVRALARRLGVDLGVVKPSGKDGLITASDVQRVGKILSQVGPSEPLRGARRAMARNMTQAHEEVVPVTVMDDADIDAWGGGENVTLRLIRAMVAGCRAEPALNAWYDTHSTGRRVLEAMHLGIATDTSDGLFVPVLRDVASKTLAELGAELETLKAAVRKRSLPPESLRGHTLMLSNFGLFAGRYANPMVLPPSVAILGAGRTRDEVVAINGQPAVRRIVPLSLTFDHRCVTGGEASRFLAAVIADLETS